MTNKDMVAAVNSIEEMKNREEDGNKVLFPGRVKVTYAIRKNKAKLEAALKPYNEERDELLAKCIDEEAQATGELKLKEECKVEWEAGIEELLNIAVDVDIHLIKLDDIADLDLSFADVDALDFMIE